MSSFVVPNVLFVRGGGVVLDDCLPTSRGEGPTLKDEDDCDCCCCRKGVKLCPPRIIFTLTFLHLLLGGCVGGMVAYRRDVEEHAVDVVKEEEAEEVSVLRSKTTPTTRTIRCHPNTLDTQDDDEAAGLDGCSRLMCELMGKSSIRSVVVVGVLGRKMSVVMLEQGTV